MRRFIRYDHLGNQVGEVSANDIMGLVRREVINGEHSLKVTTFQVLSKNERIVYEDGRGVWREYVVEGVDEEHASGKRQIGTYYCVWSVQPDLMGVPVSVMPGTQTPVDAGTALSAALSAQGRWTRGTVTNTTVSGASMYDTNTWKALGILIKNWGGELSTTIDVSSDGVVSRAVDLYAMMGEQEAYRRYDFGADVAGVKRKIPDAPLYCRISPRGKGEQSGSGWGRKVTIESVNGGKDYLEYSPMVDVCKLPNGESGYLYPTLIVENGDCDTPEKLKAWAQGALEGFCTPKVTYTVDVVQAAAEGVDVQGVSLGDSVHIVDRYFGDGLRLSGRVIELEVDEIEEHDVSVKIGGVEESISERFAELDAIRSTVEAINGGTMTTADYLSRLLERINGEVNASGGYTYITEGEGLRTYDAAVSNPLVGSEASSVVEVKGGTIRIANSKTPQGAWEWKTVFTSGHIAADLVTAANITTGMIQSSDGESYWDLDADKFVSKDADLSGKVTATSGKVGIFDIDQHELKNETMSLRDNALFFYRKDNTYKSSGGIMSFEGTSGGGASTHGINIGSDDPYDTSGQWVALVRDINDNGAQYDPYPGTPVLVFVDKSGTYGYSYGRFTANRLNFPIDMEIMPNARLCMQYTENGTVYDDYGVTTEVVAGNVRMKFRKGILVSAY